jgi:GH25 family lysozyme M1 (1,4-beta-N-acetylmuramidase)
MTVRTFQPLAGVASAQGLDVSNYQGQFSWAAAKGLSFGINRVTQGLGAAGTNSPDPEARWNHAAIRDAGLARGAYHFLDPYLDGAAQARYMVDTLGTYGLVKDDILVLDNEAAGLSPGAVARCAAAFMTELVKLRPENPRLVYTYINFAKSGNCQGLGGWPLWLAYPAATAPQPPPPWVRWTFWQWGLRNGVDADAFNGTAADLTAWIGSFRATPGAPYRHLTKAGDTIGSLAAARSMKPDSWLALQTRLGADTGMLASGPIPPGTIWLSVNP